MLQVRTAILVLTLCFVGYGQIVNSGGGGGGGGGGSCATLTGDVSGSCDANTVDKIKGGAVPVSATVVGTNASAQPVAATTTGTGTTVMLSVSPAMTGNPTAPTQTAGNNSTRLATTAYVDARGAPLEQHTAAAATELDFTTFYSSSYDMYDIVVENLFPSTTGLTFNLQCSTDGGATYVAGTSYSYAQYIFAAAGAAQGGGTGGSSIQLAPFAGRTLSTAATSATFGTLRLYNPASTTFFKQFLGMLNSVDNLGTIQGMMESGTFLSTSAINAFRVTISGGTFDGTIRVLGVPK